MTLSHFTVPIPFDVYRHMDTPLGELMRTARKDQRNHYFLVREIRSRNPVCPVICGKPFGWAECTSDRCDLAAPLPVMGADTLELRGATGEAEIVIDMSPSYEDVDDAWNTWRDILHPTGAA